MDKEALKKDLWEAVGGMEKQLDEHKVKTLMLIFEKHLNLNTGTFLLDKSDFDLIRSIAQQKVIDKSPTQYLGKNYREVSQNEFPQLCLMEATLDYLSSQNCFNKTPKFDYKKRGK